MRALVTGGGGFLGGAVCRLLRGRGDAVVSLARGDYPALRELGAEAVRGDVADRDAVFAAARGCDTVFHVAAKAGVWGDPEEYRRANVVGTLNVIDACRRLGIRRLVFTSSPSVVFDGRDIEGGDERLPYPERYEAAYPETKAEAERLVLAAAGKDLAAVALRPHLVWGPGDNHLVPRLIARRKAGSLRRIGGRGKLVDSTYIDNAAAAHLLAADRLTRVSNVSGRAYFISNGEPRPLWDLVDALLAAAGLPPVPGGIPAWAAGPAGALCEALHRALGRGGEPRLTRFTARELATAHWFDLSAARKDLGYEPKVSIEEGLSRLRASFGGETSISAR